MWFFAAMAESRLDDAYGMLCSDVQQRVSKDEFIRTRGELVSPIISWGENNGNPAWGQAEEARYEQMPDISTMNADVTRTWLEVNITRYPGPISSGQLVGTHPIELWRIDMIREGSEWKLCGFSNVGRGVTTGGDPRRANECACDLVSLIRPGGSRFCGDLSSRDADNGGSGFRRASRKAPRSWGAGSRTADLRCQALLRPLGASSTSLNSTR